MSWYILLSALWLGIMTAISPCPLATNIAAISFISRQIGHHRRILLAGTLYTLGRAFTYVLLGIGITTGLLASGEVSRFLQKYLNEILGPCLILLGMILLGLLSSGIAFNLMHNKIQKHAEKNGLAFAFPVGILFALSFCPVSAGLFFGALIPLTIKSNDIFLLPLIFGCGTALPVIVFAFIIAFGGEYLGKAFNCLTRLEIWFRYTAGILFILAGIYYSLTYIYNLNI
ncbi:MAG: aromatic aminobenezylarsenical efflux permease ArsG family transporter [Victivallaceae bacterium]